MNESNLQQRTSIVQSNQDQQAGEGDAIMSYGTENEVTVATPTTAATSLAPVVTMTSATNPDINPINTTGSSVTAVHNYNDTDIPYDLLLDDELNGFFDDEDAISTTTDEGRMGFGFFTKNSTPNDDGSAAAASSDPAVGTASTDKITATVGSINNEDGKGSNVQGVAAAAAAATTTEHLASERASHEFLSTSQQHSYNKDSTDPIPLDHLHHHHHHQQQRHETLPTAVSSTATASLKNDTSTIVVKGGNTSVMDASNLDDDIIIDGVEPTAAWHSPNFDRHHRQAMIQLM
jgi:hypothetical protein